MKNSVRFSAKNAIPRPKTEHNSDAKVEKRVTVSGSTKKSAHNSSHGLASPSSSSDSSFGPDVKFLPLPSDGTTNRSSSSLSHSDSSLSPGSSTIESSSLSASIDETSAYIKYLRQGDFQTGTYRIRRGGTYIFEESVIFDALIGAESGRADIPPNGLWFAAITIETKEVVIIDGNRYSIQESKRYQNKNKIGTFTHIVVGNNIFAGALFGTGGAAFSDTPQFVNAENVIIRNLLLGPNSHFGVRAVNPVNLTIENCEFRGQQLTHITMQAPINYKIKKCKFVGPKDKILVNIDETLAFLALIVLGDLARTSTPEAAAQAIALQNFMRVNPERFNVGTDHPGTFYSILIVPGTTSTFRFPVREDQVAIAQALTDGGPAQNGVIEDCLISDIITENIEIVSLGTNIPENPFNLPLVNPQLAFFGLFGTIKYLDAFRNGVFEPNEFLKSIALVMSVIYPLLPPPVQGLLPANLPAIIQAILTDDEALFNANVAPIVGLGSDGNFGKGLFAIRVIAADGLRIKNVKIENLRSLGAPGIVPETLPGFNDLVAVHPAIRYRGNDVWGISLEVCTNVIIDDDVEMRNLSSKSGYVFGVDLAAENKNIIIDDVHLTDFSAENTVETNVTDLGDIFGFAVENPTGPILIENSSTSNLKAAGEVSAYPDPAAPFVTLINNSD